MSAATASGPLRRLERRVAELERRVWRLEQRVAQRADDTGLVSFAHDPPDPAWTPESSPTADDYHGG